MESISVTMRHNPAQVSTSGNPDNVSISQEKPFWVNCLPIIHNSIHLFVKPKFCEKMESATSKKPCIYAVFWHWHLYGIDAQFQRLFLARLLGIVRHLAVCQHCFVAIRNGFCVFFCGDMHHFSGRAGKIPTFLVIQHC